MVTSDDVLDDDTMRNRMRDGWRMGRPYTACGDSSIPDHTAAVRLWLPQMFRDYGIKTVNDAGAGDCRWRESMQSEVDWRSFDLFPRARGVVEIDITTETLPPADAIVCRFVLNHLAGEYDDAGRRDDERVTMALDRFKASARYLFATQHDDGDLLPSSPELCRLDLRRWLGPYLARCRDGNPQFVYHLALWEL